MNEEKFHQCNTELRAVLAKYFSNNSEQVAALMSLAAAAMLLQGINPKDYKALLDTASLKYAEMYRNVYERKSSNQPKNNDKY
jgi:hypothetical protein